MSFPSNPTDQQRVTLNGIVYIWSSAKSAWQRTVAPVEGIDAATVDGLDSSQFLRNDQNQTLTGDLGVSGTVTASTAIIDSIKISSEGITAVNSGEDLVLRSLGTNSIQIDGSLNFQVPVGQDNNESFLMIQVNNPLAENDDFDVITVDDLNVFDGDSATENVAISEYQEIIDNTISNFPYQLSSTDIVGDRAAGSNIQSLFTASGLQVPIGRTLLAFGTGIGLSAGFASFTVPGLYAPRGYIPFRSYSASSGGLTYTGTFDFSEQVSVIYFWAIHGNASNGGYSVSPGEELLLQLSLNGTLWTTVFTVPTLTPTWTEFSVIVPEAFRQATVYLRFWSVTIDGSTDAWKGLALLHVITAESFPPEGESRKYLTLRTDDSETEASISTLPFNFKEIRQITFDYITAGVFNGGPASTEESVLTIDYSRNDSTSFQTYLSLPPVEDWTTVNIQVTGTVLDRVDTRLRLRNTIVSGPYEIGIRNVEIDRYSFISKLPGKLETEFVFGSFTQTLNPLTVDAGSGLSIDTEVYNGVETSTLTFNPLTASIVTYDGEETLTNKILTEPVINTPAISFGTIDQPAITGGTINAMEISGSELVQPTIDRPDIKHTSTSSALTTGTVIVNAATTSYFIREASFGAAIGIDVSNLVDGRSVFLFVRNTNATARVLTIRASTSNTNYATVLLANRGTAAVAGAVTLAANGGAVGIWIVHAGGIIRGSF